MGQCAAEKFIRHYGGEILAVPRCVAAMRAARDKKLIDDYTAGQTSVQLARKYALTQRHVWRVLKRTPEPVRGIGDRQYRLF
jgi:Mor family transcriptional regulator